MFTDSQRLCRPLVAAAAVVALAVPASSSAYHGLGSPDGTDAGIEAQREQPGYQDLRNPDRRDPAVAAQGGGATETPTRPEIAQDPGFDWGDAGIGAGSVLGLLLIMLSVAFAVVHRRSRGAEAHQGPAITS
jgi:hypothetical protein